MQQAIDLTLNRSFKIRNFEEDKAATLNANPGLRYEGEVKDCKKFSGSFYLKNESGELIESFNVIIVVNKKSYPNAFPVLVLTDDKIDRNIDYHMDSEGVVCLEHPYISNRLALGGIRIYDFINHYLLRYFSWVLVKKYGQSSKLEEWQHHDNGTIQLYQELLGTTNNKIISLFIEQYCKRTKIKFNEICYCGSGLKLKNCHLDAAILLKSTSKKTLINDLRLFKNDK